jgi:hypothetical protein
VGKEQEYANDGNENMNVKCKQLRTQIRTGPVPPVFKKKLENSAKFMKTGRTHVWTKKHSKNRFLWFLPVFTD